MSYMRMRRGVFDLYISDEVIRYINSKVKENIVRECIPVETALKIQEGLNRSGDKRTLRQYIESTDFIYTPDMFVFDFYDDLNKLAYMGLIKIYITMDILSTYFVNLRISYKVGNELEGWLIPWVSFQNVDYFGLVEYEKQLYQKYKNNRGEPDD